MGRSDSRNPSETPGCEAFHPIADRCRARVATDGPLAAARLLEADRVFRLAGSDDPALQLLLTHIGPAIVPVGTRGSFHGLRALARGDADGAAIHLRHHTGTYNAPTPARCCAASARTCCTCGAANRV